MGMVIGIDVGGSTTKIIGVDKEGIKHPMIVKAEDPITSLFGAFGKYIYDNGISLNDIDKVMLTGVGSAYVNQPLYGLSTDHTDEFLANGLGAHYDSQLQDLIVVSMGTGTSFVKVEGGENISPHRWYRYWWRNHSRIILPVVKNTEYSSSGEDGRERCNRKY